MKSTRALSIFIIMMLPLSGLSPIMVKSVLAQDSTQTPSPTFTSTPSPTPSPSPTVTPSTASPPPNLLYTTPAPIATPTPLPAPSPSPDVNPTFKPQMPKFTVYLVNHPFDVPATTPTYSTDPYTGVTSTVNPGSPGYRVDNWTIELWITNQQFNYPKNSANYNLYFDVRTKGHFEQAWRDLYGPFEGLHTATYNDSGWFIGTGCHVQSGNVYTVAAYSAYYPPYYSSPYSFPDHLSA